MPQVAPAAIEPAASSPPESIVEDRDLPPARLIYAIKTADSTGLIDMRAGQVLAGASRAKAMRLGGVFAALSDAEARLHKWETTRFSRDTGPPPVPQRAIERATSPLIPDGWSDAQIDGLLRTQPGLVAQQRQRAVDAYDAARRVGDFQQMDRRWQMFGSGSSFAGNREAERWFWNYIDSGSGPRDRYNAELARQWPAPSAPPAGFDAQAAITSMAQRDIYPSIDSDTGKLVVIGRLGPSDEATIAAHRGELIAYLKANRRVIA